MFRKHQTTIIYAALAAAIALAADIVWILATGRMQLPPGIVAVFALGAGLAATGVERIVPHMRGRRRPGGRRTHARPRPVETKTPTRGGAA